MIAPWVSANGGDANQFCHAAHFRYFGLSLLSARLRFLCLRSSGRSLP